MKSHPALRLLLISLTIFTTITIGCKMAEMISPYDKVDNIFVYSNNLNINYRIIGSGPIKILFLHGFGSSSLTWEDILPYFDKSKFAMYLVDLKGFGLSSKPEDDSYSIDNQADIILDLINQLSLKDLVVIGHSYGGAVALIANIKERAIRDSSLISNLILIDSPAFNDDIPFFISYLRLPIFNVLIMKVLPKRFTTKYTLKKLFYDKAKVTDKLIDRYLKYSNTVGFDEALMQVAEDIVPNNYDQLISQYSLVKTQVLLIWGKNDPAIPLKNAYRLHEKLHNSKLVIIDQCGHVPQEEKPIETYNAIIEFIGN